MDNESLDRRLRALERSNRRLKTTILLSGATAFAYVALGIAQPVTVPEVLTARRINIVNGAGNIVASLNSTDVGEGRVQIADQAGKESAVLSMKDGTSGIVLRSSVNASTTLLQAGREGAQLKLFDEDGVPGAILSASKAFRMIGVVSAGQGKGNAWMAIDRDGHGVTCVDDVDGKLIASAEYANNGGRVVLGGHGTVICEDTLIEGVFTQEDLLREANSVNALRSQIPGQKLIDTNDPKDQAFLRQRLRDRVKAAETDRAQREAARRRVEEYFKQKTK
jgi:hypothetical protein